MARNLEVRKVKDFAGVEFHIPAYQRGYRWRQPQTEQLLRDVEEARTSVRPGSEKPYLLQPIVLKRLSRDGETPGKYEVIDGQQRLTTIWIILQYIRNGGWRKPGKYSLVYETEVGKEGEKAAFLETLGTERQKAVQTMDEDFFDKSYTAIKMYFEGIRDGRQLDEDAFGDHIRDFCKYLQESVEVIWYEVETEQTDRDGEEIFMSLNRGRIPLESSELIKTLLLVKASRVWPDMKEDTERQTEIATEWDEMERAFSDPEFWSFIGGDDGEAVGKPRMGYFLEMLPPPNGGEWEDQEGDDYRVFNRYEKQVRQYCSDADAGRRSLDNYVLESLWREHIRANYLKLKDWSEDVRLFHKIGFLIAVKHGSQKERMELLRELLEHKGLKSELETVIDSKIKDLFKDKKPLEFEYSQKDYEAIYQLLLLFNVVSCMEEAEKSGSMACEWYSFARHAAEDWSLEHINPQSELKVAQTGDRLVWKNWLEQQKPFLKLVKNDGDSLSAETEAILRDIEKLDAARFKTLSERIVGAFSTNFDSAEEHSLSNLALLSKRDNSSIGDSIFLCKRQLILDKIANGRFVPFCTRRVFLKHYTMLDENHDVNPEEYGLVFWTTADAARYLNSIKETVARYVPSMAKNSEDVSTEA